MRVPEVFSMIFENEKVADRHLKYEIFRTILDQSLVDKNNFVSVIESFPRICEDVADLLNTPEEDVRNALLDVFSYPDIRTKFQHDLEIFNIFVDKEEEYDEGEDTEEEDEDEEINQRPILNKVVVKHHNSINTIHFVLTCFNATLAVINTIGIFQALKR